MGAFKIEVPFNTGTGTQTINEELSKLDLSNCVSILMEVILTKALTDAGDTLNVYLQSRGRARVWNDRIAAAQLLGNMTVSESAPEVREYQLQQLGTLSDTEEAQEPSGSAGGSRLTAGTVRNGPFPGKYVDAAGAPGASWRVQFDVTDADADADFEGRVVLHCNEVVA